MVFWHPIFKQEKPNKGAGHMNGTAMALTCTLGKLANEATKR